MNWQKKSWKRDMWIKFQAGVLSAETCLIENSFNTSSSDKYKEDNYKPRQSK